MIAWFWIVLVVIVSFACGFIFAVGCLYHIKLMIDDAKDDGYPISRHRKD